MDSQGYSLHSAAKGTTFSGPFLKKKHRKEVAKKWKTPGKKRKVQSGISTSLRGREQISKEEKGNKKTKQNMLEF